MFAKVQIMGAGEENPEGQSCQVVDTTEKGQAHLECVAKRRERWERGGGG